MTQRQVDLQKLLELEQKRYQQSQAALSEAKEATATIQNPLAETIASLEREVNLDIFLSNNDIKKINKKEVNKYSSTKVKARNFLTNSSYTGIKHKDFSNRSFVIDIYSFLILYFNPFNLEGKFETPVERDYVNVLWTYLLPETLYNFILKDNNIKAVNKVKVKFQDAVEIINQFIEDESIGKQEEQFNTLKEYLIKYSKIYHFIFGNLFPRYFGKIDDYGIQSKIEFNSHYQNYLLQKNVLEWERKNSFWQTAAVTQEIPKKASPSDVSLVTNKDIEIKEEKEEIKTTKQNKKNAENKIKKRTQKKRKLKEMLLENTEKLKQIKKSK